MVSQCTAFAGSKRIASGEPSRVAMAVWAALDAGEHAPILIFDDATSQPVELDLRGSLADVAARSLADDGAPEAARGRGRPKLGVIAREVTLLPRHWEWLSAQPGGASVALRKVVEAARKTNTGAQLAAQAREAADRFMLAMAGNNPGYEEAARALYAGDQKTFETMTDAWAADIREHARRLARLAFAPAFIPDV